MKTEGLPYSFYPRKVKAKSRFPFRINFRLCSVPKFAPAFLKPVTTFKDFILHRTPYVRQAEKSEINTETQTSKEAIVLLHGSINRSIPFILKQEDKFCTEG